MSFSLAMMLRVRYGCFCFADDESLFKLGDSLAIDCDIFLSRLLVFRGDSKSVTIRLNSFE